MKLFRFLRNNWTWGVPLTIIVIPVSLYIGRCVYVHPPDSVFNFSKRAKNYLVFYKPKDLWLFQDLKSRVDSIRIISIDSSYVNPLLLSLMNPVPRKTATINWMRYSRDSWYGVKEDSIRNAGKIEITRVAGYRYPIREGVSVSISSDFYFYSDSMRLMKTDSIMIGNTLFTKYYDLQDTVHGNGPNSITDVYWLNGYGIIAYKYRNGDLWKRINLP